MDTNSHGQKQSIQTNFRAEHQFAPGKINFIPAEPGRCRVNLAAMLGGNPLRRA
jgi:hypothetical protein